MDNVNGDGAKFEKSRSLKGAGGEEGETKTLLAKKVGNGGIAKKRETEKERRRVQWNDRNGNKLFEVLEFQPSDSSDSEEDESISRNRIWEYAITGCIHILCCRGVIGSNS